MTFLRLTCMVVLVVLSLGPNTVWSLESNTQNQQNILSGLTLGDLVPVKVYAVPDISAIPPTLIDPASRVEGDLDDFGMESDSSSSLLINSSQGVPIDWSYERVLPSFRSDRGLHNRYRKKTAGLSALTFRSALDASDTWTLGVKNWRYSRSDGTNLTIGNEQSTGLALGSAARLGGIALSRSASSKRVAEHEWGYSVMVGALDYSSPAAASEGGLAYGPAASDTVVRYGLSPQLTLQSQVQWAPDLVAAGFGGQYAAGSWGAWEAGVAKASHDLYQGWRYRVGYAVSVLDALKLSWKSEQRSGGFSDLTRYRNFSLDAGRSRNLWNATLPLGRWGDLTGSFEQVRSANSPLKQQFGVGQQFWYSPNLRVSLKAQHELVSGSYQVDLHFSVPLY